MPTVSRHGTEDRRSDRGHKAFWDDLTHDLRDPEFRREYAAQSKLIAEIDAAINADPPGARP